MSQSDAIFSENRELTPKEYKNLSKKVNGGYIPVNYLRKNLFNATISASKELIRLKTIYDDGTTKLVTIMEYLNQTKMEDIILKRTSINWQKLWVMAQAKKRIQNTKYHQLLHLLRNF